MAWPRGLLARSGARGGGRVDSLVQDPAPTSGRTRRQALITKLRSALAGWALRRARRADGAATDRWLARAARWSPGYSHAHAELQRRLIAQGNHATALAHAQDANRRFPKIPDAWVRLGEVYRAMYRTKDALVAFEQALVLEERADAAMAAGAAYRQLGDWTNAGARFARAYAAGAGPEALKANAEMLRKAGDLEAAEEAEKRWEQESKGAREQGSQ